MKCFLTFCPPAPCHTDPITLIHTGEQLVAAAVSHWAVWWCLFRRVRARVTQSLSLPRASQHASESNQRSARHGHIPLIAQLLPPPSAFFSLNWHVPDNEQHQAVVLNVTGYFLSRSLTHELTPLCGNLFELHFHVISLRLCLAALFLRVKPAQLLRFLLSSLWCRQTHQSGALSSNYAPLTAPWKAGTCRFFHGWHW